MFCSNCGQEASGNFCSNCGASLKGDQEQGISLPKVEEVVLLECQPAGLLDKAKSQINANATLYKVTNQRIVIESGLLSRKQEELEFNEIKDLIVKQTLTEKLTGTGSIEIVPNDSSIPHLILDSVEDPFTVKEKIRTAMMEYRRQFLFMLSDELF